MEKLSYEQFTLELTRRCNMKCPHCSRGDAQNLDMSEQVLYRSLDNLHTVAEYKSSQDKNFTDKGYTNFIFLYGGEPFLCPDTVHKLVDYILDRDIFLLGFWAITNGTVLSDSIGKDFQRIIPHIKKCQGLVVENDRSQFKGNIEEKFKRQSYIKVSCNFHDTEQSKKALEFYKQYEGIEVTLFDGDLSEDERTLSYNGRAKNLIDHKTMWFNIRNRHCMATDRWEKLVEKTITVAANGNVFLGLDYEHTDVDEDNLGNVLNESIYDMAVRWNYQNPIMLDENNKMLEAKSYVFNYENGYSGVYMDMTEELYKLNKERVQVYDRLIEIRKHFHKMYKYLTIERILFLSDMFLELEMGGTYIKNYCDEDTVQTWDYERDKELIEVSVVCLPSINEDCFFERYEYLKPLKGKFPLVDMDIEDCDRLYHALEDYKSGAADKIRQSLTVFKGLKLKYGILDIDMEIKFDEDIEQALENSSALWKLGKSVIELLKRLE